MAGRRGGPGARRPWPGAMIPSATAPARPRPGTKRPSDPCLRAFPLGRRIAGTSKAGAMNPVERAIRSVDAMQRRFTPSAFAFGVVKKFGDDNGGALVANLAYSAFVSLFPLLLVP